MALFSIFLEFLTLQILIVPPDLSFKKTVKAERSLRAFNSYLYWMLVCAFLIVVVCYSFYCLMHWELYGELWSNSKRMVK